MPYLSDMPLYSFEEIVENIRWAETPQDVILWVNQVMDDRERYCQFHLRLIIEATRQKRLSFQSNQPT